MAASSYSSRSDASRIRFSMRWVNPAVWPPMKARKSLTIARCSSGLTRPTHGAAHLPMSPSRQGRPIAAARRNTPAEHERIGNTRSRVSTVSRIAQAWPYGPKYRTPLRCAPRMTVTRGNSSPTVTASQGYDLSSRYLTLKRGSNSLIQEYSSASASTSVLTTVQSTEDAVSTICWVRGCRPLMSWKYELSRGRSDLALPT